MKQRSALGTLRLRASCWILSHMPARMACAVLCLAGSLQGALTRGGRRRQLRQYFAKGAAAAGRHESSDRIMRRHFRHEQLLRFAPFLVARSRAENLSAVLSVRGWEHVEAALAGGRGCILAGAHFGAPALPGAYAASRGVAVWSLRNEDLRPLEGTWQGDLMFHGAKPIFTARDEPPAQILKRALAALEQGGAMLHLVDGVLGARGVTVPIFGCNVFLRTGAMDLARIARCPIIPAFGAAVDGQLEVEFFEPSALASQENVEAFARRYAALYERLAAARLDNATWKHMDRFVLAGKDVPWHRGPVDPGDAPPEE